MIKCIACFLYKRVVFLGRGVFAALSKIGSAACFIGALWRAVFRRPFRWRLIVHQIHYLGNYSLSIISVAGAFVGMVLALQAYNVLQRYGAVNVTGVSVALSLLRELGVVVTALLFAGRAGSALTSEIGLMKSSYQLVAMEVMSVSPFNFVLVPRFLAGLITLPLLSLVFNVCGILGGFLIAVPWLGLDGGIFWSQIQSAVATTEIQNAVIKSVVFAFAVNTTALYQGYYANPTPRGVSKATTRCVVVSSLLVLILDFLMSYMMLV